MAAAPGFPRGRPLPGGHRPPQGRVAHWVKGNAAERIPLHWIVADSEARRDHAVWGEDQTLRCVVGHAWRTDVKSGEADSWHKGISAYAFWEWVTNWCYTHGRTVLWFHNASYDLRTLDAFRVLPGLGYELEWCNLDNNVSVCNWRGANGTLIIADTWTWTNKGLAAMQGATGIKKPRLPKDDDSIEAWLARCTADVQITEAIVRDLVGYVRNEHLGNWQPSGAGMGYSTWRHKFMTHKILIHDDTAALAAEREAMHAGRAEAWHHGDAIGGPFTEWDMHMSYPTIAAECDVPAKLRDHDVKPSRRVHEWAMKYFGVLARVIVKTAVACVPAKVDGRIMWPVGQFETTLWDTELKLITATGGTYKVLEQWRYVMRPALKAWAEWSIQQCGLTDDRITPIQRTWVKHQSRAVIGRFALRHASWERWSENPGGYCGISHMLDIETGETSRLMHVGSRVFRETERKEAESSAPQIPSYIMAMARVRLWEAVQAAGPQNVLHMDTDSLICNKAGSALLRAAIADGLPGNWREKKHWRRIRVTGPRHYRTPDRNVIPGVPLSAVETRPGVFEGEVWESLGTSLAAGQPGSVRIHNREWQPKRVDYRRPWTEDEDHPALPVRVGFTEERGNHAASADTEELLRRNGHMRGLPATVAR
jgi:hypothetical protein